MSFTTTVKVTAVTDEDFGALATLVQSDDGGIDVTLNAPIGVQVNADTGSMFKPGALVDLTFSVHQD